MSTTVSKLSTYAHLIFQKSDFYFFFLHYYFIDFNKIDKVHHRLNKVGKNWCVFKGNSLWTLLSEKKAQAPTCLKFLTNFETSYFLALRIVWTYYTITSIHCLNVVYGMSQNKSSLNKNLLHMDIFNRKNRFHQSLVSFCQNQIKFGCCFFFHHKFHLNTLLQ